LIENAQHTAEVITTRGVVRITVGIIAAARRWHARPVKATGEMPMPESLRVLSSELYKWEIGTQCENDETSVTVNFVAQNEPEFGQFSSVNAVSTKQPVSLCVPIAIR